MLSKNLLLHREYALISNFYVTISMKMLMMWHYSLQMLRFDYQYARNVISVYFFNSYWICNKKCHLSYVILFASVKNCEISLISWLFLNQYKIIIIATFLHQNCIVYCRAGNNDSLSWKLSEIYFLICLYCKLTVFVGSFKVKVIYCLNLIEIISQSYNFVFSDN